MVYSLTTFCHNNVRDVTWLKKMNENKERRRRHTFPVRRQKSYSHNEYVRELYKSYILPETVETSEPDELTQTERVPASDTKQISVIERHFLAESYPYTSQSNPNLRPLKSSTTTSSANRLPRPQSRNDHDRSRSSSPFCRNVGKEVTDNFLFDRNIWNICEISKKRPLNFVNIKECERLRGSPITSIFSDSILEMDNSHLREIFVWAISNNLQEPGCNDIV
ncbi:unnamed protein product [Rhizophagus irregularis]|uniref:Uncharacterized protein n=1 Tax=Rhizophagus irregularis TaxID=588596 RepID=A0A915YWT2_9GLOM|nr:unnamed protein product [Rhizophagus irregularis]